MSWVSVGVGAASVVSGLFGSKSAKKQQKQQLQLQRDSLNFAKDRYNEANTLYKPVQQLVVNDAMEGVKADLQGVSDRAAADVAQQYSGIGAALQRNQARMGINPNSGQAMAAQRQTALSQALASAGGITRSREAERNNAEQQTWSRRFSVGQMGVNQMNGTASAVNDASNGLASTYGNMANNTAQGAAGLMAAGGQLITGGLAGTFGQPTGTAPLSTNNPLSLSYSGLSANSNTGMNNATSGVVPSQAKTFTYPSIGGAAPSISTPMANTTLGNSNYFNQNGEPF